MPIYRRALCALAMLFSLMTAYGQTRSSIEPGVSLSLAQQRAAILSAIRYDLSFTIPEDQDEDIDAAVRIGFELSDASQPLLLDFRERPDRIRTLAVNGRESGFRFINEHIVIPADELVAGANETRIEFTAGTTSLNRNPEFLYTLFVPDRARTAFPLFDQPNLKAVFELSLTVPPGWTAIGGAPLQALEETDRGMRHRFAPTELISSYLFSFVAGKFETVKRTIGGREMTMLHRETDEEKVARNIDEMFNLHAAALDWLEDYTGIDYPYAQFGFALIPAHPYGGMEHTGAIQYDASILFLEEAPSDPQLLDRASLIAHETAHMWFGNLVTMDWFNDVWTKEVFANFMAAKIVYPSFPQINHDLNFLVSHYPDAYSVDRTAGANPIRQHLDNMNQAGQLYGAIIYQKAPIMMRKLEKLIGEDRFREGMRQYLGRFAFSNATWPSLIEILDAKSDENLRAWSEVWVNTPGREAIQGQWNTPAEGEGGPFRYGLVPADFGLLQTWSEHSEVDRAALLINLYEGLLAGLGPAPQSYFRELLDIVQKEDNALILNLALTQMQNTYWLFLPIQDRDSSAATLEQALWDSMLTSDEPSIRKVFFEAFSDVAITPDALARLQGVWSGEMQVDRLPLSENDLIQITRALAIKLPGQASDILGFQMARTENPDNLRKLQFTLPSLSADPKVRDAFFESLADEANRSTESWVLDALRNLHHPLRTARSERYIQPGLELLEEIQVTGDIFFPKRWLNATLTNYRTTSAVETVNEFLAERPDYNEQLRMKILQSAHILFRANAIATAQAGSE
jgi:aminopeptidase N